MTDPFALVGLRIVSLAEQYPGPYATLVLSDLGADVVIVERPPSGDPARRAPAFHAALNRGKRAIALDLKSPGGHDALLALASRADVLIEGFRPGTLARLGLGYAEVSAANPRIVYASISGFGQDGPDRDVPGHDLSFQAISGHLSDRLIDPVPQTPQFPLGNVIGGLFAAIGILTALRSREATGRGTYVDISLLDGLVSALAAHLGPLLDDRGPAFQSPDPGYGLFRTSDRKVIALSIFGEDHYWAALCRLVGLDADAELDTATRIARYDALQGRLRGALAKGTLAMWSGALRAKKIPFTPVLGLPEVTTHPQVRARGLVTTVPADGANREQRYIRQPIRIGGESGGPVRHAPAVGEHTRAVLTEAGYGAERIAELIGSGAAFAPLHDARGA